MKREFSLYLDVVRLLASLLVVLYHSANIYNPGGVLFTLGHEAVVVFFVLSGFVIAYVADSKEKNLREYAISRISRIYSVAIPAILLTLIADQLGFRIDLSAYSEGHQAWDYPLVRVFGSLFFLNEVWWNSIQSFSNVPYWSLNYEIWYYVVFGVVTFLQGTKRWWLFLLIIIFLGPKILLLMPIWWLGVFIYRSRMLKDMSKFIAVLLFVVSLLGLVCYVYFHVSKVGWNLLEGWLGETLHKELSYSRYVLSDYLLALLISAHFVSVNVLASTALVWLNSYAKLIRYTSSFTFAIYLFHQPLLLFFSALIGEGEVNFRDYSLILCCTLFSIWALGLYTERKRPSMKKVISRVFDWHIWRYASPAGFRKIKRLDEG